MPKSNFIKPDPNKILGAKLEASMISTLMDKNAIARKTGVHYNTINRHYKEPEKISLSWLKRFIKATNMDPNIILEYLYEGKYYVRVEHEQS